MEFISARQPVVERIYKLSRQLYTPELRQLWPCYKVLTSRKLYTALDSFTLVTFHN